MDIGKIGLQKHHIKAIIEVDVTLPRKEIKRLRREQGVTVSFTSWILKCIGQAIDEYKQVHALRKGRNKLVIFNTIDISIVVEKMVEGVLVPLPLVIRDVTHKDLAAITDEIEQAKNQEIKDEKNYVLEQNRKMEPIKLFTLLPQFIRLFIWKIILSNPYRIKRMMGTVMVSSVGMMGNVRGWFIPYSIHPICFALGSIIKKPGATKNSIEIRQFLEMTILIDHDVVDGAPAARFVSRLKDLVESGYGL
ncbi:MAG: 2-oxo acid dehydrogenase subunit E2 [Spirochaetales bacterium]|nr:2-oxo acid dehydrogenase subunit E2 [Spirochaetales bacterium]